jgi:hypothetical protein
MHLALVSIDDDEAARLERRRRQAQNPSFMQQDRGSLYQAMGAAAGRRCGRATEHISMSTDENRTKVSILTQNYRVKGYIDLLPGARVTDYLVESKDFIAVTDAEVWELGNRHVLNAPFINVSRDHIQIVAPGD